MIGTQEPQGQHKTNLYNELQELKLLEGKVAKLISPNLLDYTFIFAPDLKYDLEITALSKDAINVLNQYIFLANRLLQKFAMPLQKPATNIVATFLDSLHDMYLLRYLDAKILYAEYELYRIPTLFETKVNQLKYGTKVQEGEPMISLIIPEGLIENENRDIDWIKTISNEKQEHKIARYMLAYKKAYFLQHQFFFELQNISTKKFAYTIYKKEIEELVLNTLTTAIFHFSNDIYKYLDRNYLISESMVNVYEYYNTMLVQGNNQFMGQYNDLFNELRRNIIEELRSIKVLNQNTIDVIVDDFFEVIIAYIKTQKLLSSDYYSIAHRDQEQFLEHELGMNYNNLLDFYLYVPEGGHTDMAMETFNVDFSTEAKLMIFKAVVGENENPLFTLNNYLTS